MSIQNSLRSNFTYHQVMIAKSWMERAKGVKDPFLIFISYFTAFNSLYWCCSDKDTDAGMLSQFKAVFISSLSERELKEIALISSSIINLVSQEFGEVHKLHKRSNNREAPALKYFDNISLQTIVSREIGEAQQIDVCVSLLYQFRCNLVHGSKNTGLRGNERLANEFNHFMRELIKITILKLDV